MVDHCNLITSAWFSLL